MAIPDYVRDVKPFDDANKNWTDEEIAFQISGQTIGPIDRETARTYHAENDWWDEGRNQTYSGELEALHNDPSTPDDIDDALEGIWKLLFRAAQSTMRTEIQLNDVGEARNKQGAGETRQMFEYAVGLVQSTNGLNQKTVRNYYNLGGGLKYNQGVSAAEVNQSRVNFNSETGRDAENSRVKGIESGYYNQFVAPQYTQVGPATEQAVIDAYIQVATEWQSELTGETLTVRTRPARRGRQ